MTNFKPRLALLLFLLLSSAINAQQLTQDQYLKMLLPKLALLDRNASNLRLLYKSSYDFFEKRYVYPFSRNGKINYTTFEELIQSTHHDPNAPVYDYAKTIEISNQYLDFTHPFFYYTIIIDLNTDPKILTSSMIEYSIGLMLNIARLENSDLKHTQEIQQLKKIILKRIILYADSSTWGAGFASIEPMKLIYFYLMVNSFSNFPSNLTNDLGIKLSGFITDKNTKLKKHEIHAASNLLLDLSLYCYSNCSQPILTRQNALSSKEFYIKSLFDLCENASNKSLINTRASNFYVYYLEILRRINDPKYKNIQASIIKKDLFGGLRQISSDLNHLWQSPNDKLAILEIGISNIFKTIKIFILYSFNEINSKPIWFWLYLLVIYMLSFTGKNRIILKKLSKKRILRSLSIPFKNAKKAIITGDDFYHRIAINIFFLATTLLISNLETLIENYV